MALSQRKGQTGNDRRMALAKTCLQALCSKETERSTDEMLTSQGKAIFTLITVTALSNNQSSAF